MIIRDNSDAQTNRRRILSAMVTAAVACAILAARLEAGDVPGRPALNITCFIRYQIDPTQRAEFALYAATWSRVIPRCGGHLVGYFLPYEGTNDVAWGLIAFDSLASYESYRKRLRTDSEARANFDYAQTKRFVLREERSFLEIVDGSFELQAVAPNGR